MCLYKYVFPPHLPHPSLAFIGLLQLLGGVFPAQEAQSRWFALLMNKKLSLPPPKEMQAAYAKWRAKLESRYIESLRHTFQVKFVTRVLSVSVYGSTMCEVTPLHIVICVL